MYLVHLHRREHSKVVVLSSNEKYVYAMRLFEPLMEHMVSLSSENFYLELEKWESIVSEALGDNQSSSSVPGKPDDNDGTRASSDEMMDAADITDTTNATGAAEGSSSTELGDLNWNTVGSIGRDARYLEYESLSQASLPVLHKSDASQDIIQATDGIDCRPAQISSVVDANVLFEPDREGNMTTTQMFAHWSKPRVVRFKFLSCPRQSLTIRLEQRRSKYNAKPLNVRQSSCFDLTFQ